MKTMSMLVAVAVIGMAVAVGIQAQSVGQSVAPPQNVQATKYLTGEASGNPNAAWIMLRWVSNQRYQIERCMNGSGGWKALPCQGWDFYADVVQGPVQYRIRTVNQRGEVSVWVYTPLIR